MRDIFTRRHLHALIVTVALIVAAVAGSCYAAVSADTKAPPALTETQKLQLTTLLQRLEIAQLKAQAVQREFDTAKAELLAVAQRLVVDGFELDLQTLAYRATPKEPAR